MGTIRRTETSASNHHYSLRNNPVQRRSRNANMFKAVLTTVMWGRGVVVVSSYEQDQKMVLLEFLSFSALLRGRKYCNTTYLLTYLLTPYSRVLLEKLTGFQLVKKFPAFYGTRRFITALTSARHLSLSCASSIQSTPPYPTS